MRNLDIMNYDVANVIDRRLRNYIMHSVKELFLQYCWHGITEPIQTGLIENYEEFRY